MTVDTAPMLTTLNASREDLEKMALSCRRNIVDMVYRAKAGHPGGSLSVIDILVALYGTQLRVSPDAGSHPDRDRLILSKGHASPAMYAVLESRGFLTETDLESYRVFGGTCQGHVDMDWTNGVDFSAGSLGMGLSFGIGCAIAARMDESDRATWVILGDGECQEGEVWEAAMAAQHHNLTKLHVIVDRNRIQNDDHIDRQMRLGDLAAKWESFGWSVLEIDGHDMGELTDALHWCKEIDRPTAIIAHTVKGKGVSFMEDDPSFHGKAPNDEEYILAMEELS